MRNLSLISYGAKIWVIVKKSLDRSQNLVRTCPHDLNRSQNMVRTSPLVLISSGGPAIMRLLAMYECQIKKFVKSFQSQLISSKVKGKTAHCGSNMKWGSILFGR